MPGLPPPSASSACLITGASSGIGAALAKEFASRGYNVVLVARRRGRLEELAGDLANRFGVSAWALDADLKRPEQREGLADRVQGLGTEVSVLVNNAGVATSGRFVERERSGELAQIQLSCEAVVDLCGLFVPAMTQRGSGAVLITSSVSGLRPVPNTATYGAAKAFALSFGQALHAEVRGAGVAVTTLCPGPVETEIFGEEPHPSQRLPALAWKSSDAVAREAVDALSVNKRVVIPGRVMRAAATSSALMPRGLHLRATERLYRVGKR